jgi:beta-lactamase class D OXA-10
MVRRMKQSTLLMVVLLVVFVSPISMASSIVETRSWNDVFANRAVEGVFVLCRQSRQSCRTNNMARATTRFIPASTFKIANALIGLETGVIEDERQVFKWDGKAREMHSWEQDFVLRGAMQASAVPVFQQIARQIGATRMQAFLKGFNYGNAETGGGIDRFWLDGDLRISAIEQIDFLESLKLGKLPASERNQLIVKDALVSAATDKYLLRAKSGYTGSNDKIKPAIAWWTGWVESGTDVYFFAFNMDVTDEDDLLVRKTLPTEIMRREGVPID